MPTFSLFAGICLVIQWLAFTSWSVTRPIAVFAPITILGASILVGALAAFALAATLGLGGSAPTYVTIGGPFLVSLIVLRLVFFLEWKHAVIGACIAVFAPAAILLLVLLLARVMGLPVG